MTFIRDSRESRPEIQAAADRDELLEYRLPENQDAAYSYDARIEWLGGAVRVEIKQWGDYVASWQAGKLERQLSAVDCFIVERDPMQPADDRPDEADYRNEGTFSRAVDGWRQVQNNAEMHLVSLSFQMPVLRSTGVHQTIAILRRIEATAGGQTVRANRVKRGDDSPRFAILNALPGINAHRPLGDGRTLGDAVWAAYADPQAVAQALGIARWVELPGVGPKAVQKALAAVLGPKTDVPSA